MPLKWTELSGSQEFKALPAEEQEKSRAGYFDQNIAPTIAPGDLGAARQHWDARTLPKPADPAAAAVNQDSNVTSPNALARPATASQAVPQNPTKIERPKGAAGFVEGVKDFGRGVAAGVVQNLPDAAAGLADFADTPTFDAAGNNQGDEGVFSKWARETREAGAKRGENWQQSEFGRQMQEQDAFSARGASFEAGKNLPLSFGPGIAGAVAGAAVGGLPGAAAGFVGGSLLALPLFFGHQAKDTYDKVYAETRATNPDLTDEQVHDESMKAGALTGSIEAGGELVADLVGAKLFKMLPSGIKSNLVKAATKGFQGAVPMAKEFSKVVGTEVATEVAQGAGQAEVEKRFGVGEGATWDNQKGVIMPTILMTLVGGGASAGMSANMRYRNAKLLENAKAPAEHRLAAAESIAQVLHGEDPELANLFYQSASQQIQAGKPVIAKADRFYRDMKPLDQREIDKRMAAGDFSDPDKPFNPLDKVGEGIATAQPDPIATVPADPSQPIEFAATTNNQEISSSPLDAAPEPMTRPMRQTLMADISAQLKVARMEREAAKAAGDEKSMAELNDEIHAIATNFKRVSKGLQPEKTPRELRHIVEYEPITEPTASAGLELAPLEPAATDPGNTIDYAPPGPGALDAKAGAIEKATDDYQQQKEDDSYLSLPPGSEPAEPALLDDLPPAKPALQEVHETAIAEMEKRASDASKLAAQDTRGKNSLLTQDKEILHAIAAEGGLDRAGAEAQGIDPAHFNERVGGLNPIFKVSGGRSLDDMAEHLSQSGFFGNEPYSANALLDMVSRSLGGEEVFSPQSEEGRRRQASQVEAEQLNAALENYRRHTYEDDNDPPAGPIYTAATNPIRAIAREANLAEIVGVPEHEIDYLLDSNLSDDDIIAALQEKTDARRQKTQPQGAGTSRAEGNQTAPRIPESAQESAQPARQEVTPPEENQVETGTAPVVVPVPESKPSQETDDFALQQETEADRAVREEADRDQAETAKKAEKKARKKKEQKDTQSAVDSSFDRFELGQSTEQQLSGQTSVFDQPPAQSTTLSVYEQPGLMIELDGKRYPVDSLADAATKFAQARDRVFDGGGRSDDVPTPKILDASGKQIAYISQNGRIWEGKAEDWNSQTKELPGPFAQNVKAQEIDTKAPKEADRLVEFTGTELGKDQPIKGMVLKAQAMARKLFADKTIHIDDENKDVLVPWQGIKKALSGEVSKTAALVASKLDKVIQNGRKVREEPDNRQRSNVQSVEFYQTDVSVAGEKSLIEFVVRVMKDGSRYYDHYEVLEKQKARRSHQEVGPGDGGPKGQPIQADIASIANSEEINQPTDKVAAVPAELSPILTKTKKQYLTDKLKEQGIKKNSPGYLNAYKRAGDSYDDEMDRAQAALPFSEFNKLNSESPEQINRSAWETLRKEYGIEKAEEINARANEAATSPQNDLPDPTPAQIAADNYKKGKPFTLHGQTIVIENPRDSMRGDKETGGKVWQNKMAAHYGDLKGTTGADGDAIDVFVGQNPESERIFIIDQQKKNGDKGGFDEHKVMAGFSDQAAAEKAYLDSYEKGWGIGPITELSPEEFKDWIESGDHAKAYSEQGEQAVAPPKSRKTPLANTDDVGGEMIQNRRNFRGITLKDLDGADNESLQVVMAQKGKVWERPDYEALVDGGVEPMAAHLLKQIYDSIGNKPVYEGEKYRRAYVETVLSVRSAAEHFINDTEAMKGLTEAILEMTKNRSSFVIGLEAREKQDKYGKVILDRAFPKNAQGKRWGRENEEGNTRVLAIGGKKFIEAANFSIDSFQKAAKAINEGWPAKQEAWQRQFKIEEKDGVFHVKQKNGYRSLAEAATHDEAVAKARDLAKSEGRGEKFKEPKVELAHVVREGIDYREGRNASTQELQDTFGFRKVNFGNWMKGDSNAAERQAHVNHIYDGMMDLATILNLPPNAMSLNGMLSIAVGAQGKGGAAAHFYPGVNEINITRESGAGSMAHEFGHALDHYFGVQAGLGGKNEPFLSEVADRIYALKESQVRQEVLGSFKTILNAMESTEVTRTPEEMQAFRDGSLARSKKSLENRLTEWRRSIENAPGVEPAKKEESLSKFDAIADMLREGEGGEKVQLGNSKGRYVHKRVDELRKLVKVSGSYLPGLDSTQWLSVDVGGIELATDSAKFAEIHKPQITQRSNYKKAASKKDGKRKPYWDTRLEMFARAFEIYVLDANEKRTDYLTAAWKAGEEGIFAEEAKERYPQGEERKSINDAFRKLFDVIESRETDSGVGLFAVHDEPVAILKGTEIDVSEDPVRAAKKYYSSNFQGKTADSPAGKVRFSGKGWNKLKRGLPTDRLKVQIIPAIKDIIERGEYHGREELYSERSDDVVAFHFFTGNVVVGDKTVQAGVSVAEDSRGNLFYNLNHDTDALWEKIKPRSERDGLARKVEAVDRRLPRSEARGADLNVIVDPFGGTVKNMAAGPVMPSGNVTVANVQKIADKIGGNWGIDVHVIQSMDQLPDVAKGELRRQGITSAITGYFDRKTKAIYLVADAMRNQQEAQVTLLHEAVGHLGIETVMGPEINQFLKTVYDSRESDPVIKAAWDYVNRPTTYAGASEIVQAAEIVARIAESDPKHTLVQRFIQMVRQALRKIGFNIPFHNNDIIEALRRAKRALEDGSYAGEGSEGGLFQMAHHGSPHRFKKFSTDKMGSGEGTQAYGWGMYFAQKKDIAEHYRDGLATTTRAHNTLDGKKLTDKAVDQLAQSPDNGINMIAMRYGRQLAGQRNIQFLIEDSIRSVDEQIDEYERRRDSLQASIDKGTHHSSTYSASDYQERIDGLAKLRGQMDAFMARTGHVPEKVNGSLYTVDVPEDYELLDYDALLSDQPEGVKSIINGILDSGVMEADSVKAVRGHNAAGGNFYTLLSMDIGGDKQASLLLREKGIPGLRFFDHMSRFQPPPVPQFTAWAEYFKGADLDNITDWERDNLRSEYDEFVNAEDTRTRNFVIFDDERVEITDTLFRVTEAPEFQRWFGDSKVVGDNGEPLVMYHGTMKDFTDFKRGQWPGTINDIGSWFTNDSETANVFGRFGSVMSVYLKVENPLYLDSADEIKALWKERGGGDDQLRGGDTEAVRNWLRSQGYDGISMSAEDMDGFAKGVYVVPLDPEQIKSATGNSGTFDPDSPNILFRATDPDDAESPARGLRATMRDRLDAVRFQMQDKLIDLKRIQEDVDPADNANPYQKASIWEGKAGERISDFDDDSVQPLLTAIADTGMEWDDVGNWLVARHAKEANAYLAEINPDMEDDKRYRLSGMTDERAAEILDQHSNNRNLWQVGNLVDRINRERVEMLVGEGLITQDSANAWQGRYQFYVPLKREEAEGGDMLPARGQGFNIKGKESKARTGSADWTPGKIVANVLAQYEASIVRAEKNKVGQALLEFVNQNPDDSFWAVDTERTQKSVRNGKVVEGPKFGDMPNELTVKKDGVEHVIVFNPSNPKAVRLVTGMKNLQAAEMGSVMRAMATVTRFLATINTSWNPEFMVSNFARDVQTAAYNLSDTDISDMRGRVIKDIPAAMNGIRSALFGDGGAEWAPIWEDFRKNGGKTGWLDIHGDVKKKEEDLKAMAARLAEGKPSRKLITRFVKKVEDMNNVIENGVRLAAYKNALDAGLSKDRAAALAKDLTVNFNRKGNQGAKVNALYMFYNAAVQGNVRMIQAMASSKQGRKLAYATIGFAIALDMINRSLSGDDDDGEDAYDTLPDYVKDRNIIVMGEKEPILKIPAPWGYNVLHVIGQVIGQAMTGERYNALDSASRVGMALVDAFNPMGSGTFAQVLSPTVTDPIVQIAENKNFAGIPLKPEHTFDSRVPKPEYQMHWGTSREASNAIAKFLNDATGGNEIRPGAINVSPEWIDVIVDSVTGGLGMTAANTLDTATRLLSGDELPADNIPFLRRVTGFNNEKGVKGRYYEWGQGVAYAKSEAKNLRGKDLAEARKNPEYRMIPLYTSTEKQLVSMRKMRRNMVERGSSEESIGKLDERIRAVMARFNKSYADTVLN